MRSTSKSCTVCQCINEVNFHNPKYGLCIYALFAYIAYSGSTHISSVVGLSRKIIRPHLSTHTKKTVKKSNKFPLLTAGNFVPGKIRNSLSAFSVATLFALYIACDKQQWHDSIETQSKWALLTNFIVKCVCSWCHLRYNQCFEIGTFPLILSSFIM